MTLSKLFNSSRMLCSSFQHQTQSQLIQTSKSLPSINFFLRQIRTQSHKLSAIRSGRRSFHLQNNNRSYTNYEILRGPFLFTVTFCSACLIGGTIWKHENGENRVREFVKVESLRRWWNKRSQQSRSLVESWQQLHEGNQIFILLVLTNIAVLMSWRFKNEKIRYVMRKYFLSPYTGAPLQTSWPLLFSAFSHQSFFHLGINMYCLSSFMDGMVNLMGKEQFLAGYLSTAVLAGFGSLVCRVLIKHHVSSIGASGAIIAMLTMFVMNNPDTKLQLIFPPITFPAVECVMYWALLEFCAIIFLRNTKWYMIDHGGHLAGLISGYCLSHFGPNQKKYIVEAWEGAKEICSFSGQN